LGQVLVADGEGRCMRASRRLRDMPGVLLRDLPRFRHALAHSGQGFESDPRGWISLCNRIESLSTSAGMRGVACDWQWGSTLHATDVLPSLKRKLLHAALAEWPIHFSPRPLHHDEIPVVTFVFAHSGVDRLPQLVRTIQSVFAQSIACECLVVDQSPVPLFAQLPHGISYRHLSKLAVPQGWHKSWAYNVGARLARGRILVFNDGDICVPTRYAEELLRTFASGSCQAASLQRLLFYLSEDDTRRLNESGRIAQDTTPVMAFQNWKGGTIAVTREAFSAIGGFDEGFVDWGGEDDEFFDRCGAIGHCRNGFLPFVHLWHPPQPDRKASSNPNIAHVMPRRMAIPHQPRIEELQARNWGDPARPDPLLGYKHKPTPA